MDHDYLPKNVLITGGAGFIGSHVAILLATKYPEYKVSFSSTDVLLTIISHAYLLSHESNDLIWNSNRRSSSLTNLIIVQM